MLLVQRVGAFRFHRLPYVGQHWNGMLTPHPVPQHQNAAHLFQAPVNGLHPHVGLVSLHGIVEPSFRVRTNRFVLVVRPTVLHEINHGSGHQRVAGVAVVRVVVALLAELRLQEVALVQVRGFHLQLHLNPVLLFRYARDVAVHDVLNLQHAPVALRCGVHVDPVRRRAQKRVRVVLQAPEIVHFRLVQVLVHHARHRLVLLPPVHRRCRVHVLPFLTALQQRFALLVNELVPARLAVKRLPRVAGRQQVVPEPVPLGRALVGLRLAPNARQLRINHRNVGRLPYERAAGLARGGSASEIQGLAKLAQRVGFQV